MEHAIDTAKSFTDLSCPVIVILSIYKMLLLDRLFALWKRSEVHLPYTLDIIIQYYRPSLIRARMAPAAVYLRIVGVP